MIGEMMQIMERKEKTRQLAWIEEKRETRGRGKRIKFQYQRKEEMAPQHHNLGATEYVDRGVDNSVVPQHHSSVAAVPLYIPT